METDIWAQSWAWEEWWELVAEFYTPTPPAILIYLTLSGRVRFSQTH